MKIIQKYKSLDLNDKIFYGLTILSLGIWAIFFMGFLGACVYFIIKSGISGFSDFIKFINFGDFFDVLNFISGRNPYNSGFAGTANYPPFAYMILYPFAKLAGANGVTNLLQSTRGILSLCLFYCIGLSCITVLTYKLFTGQEKNKRVLFTLFIMFSFPVIYLVIRANVLLMTLIFILFFINYYKSDNKILKELAILALALAVATKLYPVFFGILLLRERRFLDCFKAAFYSVILFILPFFFFKGGMNNISYFFNDLINFTKYSNSRIRDVSIDNVVRILFELFGIKNAKAYKITALVLMIIITILSIVASLFIKKKWKVFLLIAMICITTPIVSFAYSFVFLIPSLAFFFEEEKVNTDMLFAMLFLILFSVLGFFLYLNAFIILGIQIALIIQSFEAVLNLLKRLFNWAKGLDKKLKFLFVGGLNTVLGLGVYYIVLLSLGVDLSQSNTNIILERTFATILSTLVGVVNSYFWNKNFTFESREKNFGEKVRFIIVYAVATLLDLGIKTGLGYTNLNEYVIPLITVIAVMITTYLGQRFFVFRKAIEKNESLKKNEEKSINQEEKQKLISEEEK